MYTNAEIAKWLVEQRSSDWSPILPPAVAGGCTLECKAHLGLPRQCSAAPLPTRLELRFDYMEGINDLGYKRQMDKNLASNYCLNHN